MPDVFISHASRDREAVERELVLFLRKNGVAPWYSRDDIRSAAVWETQIRRALQESEWFLIALTPAALGSEWVRSEVHWAMEKRSERTIPVMLEPCDPSELHLQLIRYQYIDFVSDRERGRKQLLALFGKAPKAPSAELLMTVTDGELTEQKRLEIVDVAIVGRDEANDLFLVNPKLSRRHASFKVREYEGIRSLWIADLGSLGGVAVNGVSITAPRQLAEGDVITVGNLEIRVDAIDWKGGNRGPA
jgi:hypothetical protein